MKVRLFVPPPGNAEGDYSGYDYDFEVMPSVGQMIRMTYGQVIDYEAEKVGFIQDGDDFVACVWMREIEYDSVGKFLDSLRGQ